MSKDWEKHVTEDSRKAGEGGDILGVKAFHHAADEAVCYYSLCAAPQPQTHTLHFVIFHVNTVKRTVP